MATLTHDALPDTIKQAKGTIDYYHWRGIQCVRKWPQYRGGPRSAAVQAAEAQFIIMSRAANNISPALRAAATQLGAPYNYTWKDVITAASYGTLYIVTPS